MTQSLVGSMVVFNRSTPSNWPDFVSNGDRVHEGDIGIVIAYESKQFYDVEMKVYLVLVAGRIVSAWGDEIIVLVK
jgi:hypothetical protein